MIVIVILDSFSDYRSGSSFMISGLWAVQSFFERYDLVWIRFRQHPRQD